MSTAPAATKAVEITLSNLTVLSTIIRTLADLVG